MKELEQSLINLTIVITKYRVFKPEGFPLTGEEYSQLFIASGEV